MILRVILKNFLSFDDEVQFDMFPNMKRTSLSNHISMVSESVPVLKMAAVYGANGAGKSNLLKGVNFIKALTTHKEFLNREKAGRYFYALRKDAGSQLMELTMEFTTKEGSAFIYSVKVVADGIRYETLKLSGLGSRKNRDLLIRDGEKLTFAKEPSEEVRKMIAGWLERNPFSSLLTINDAGMPVLQDENIDIACKWFREELKVIGIHSFHPGIIGVFKYKKEVNDFASDLFRAIDLGIDEVKVETENFDEWIVAHDEEQLPLEKVNSMQNGVLSEFVNSRNTMVVSVENGVRLISRMMFEQFGKDGFSRDMDILSQSDGTVRLLSLVPALYAAFKCGTTVLIDELEHSIHPHLVRELVRYFSTSKTTGQLIFTTHQTCLLNQNFIRTDEIWFVEKENGSSKMYSLNDFKIHHTINIENGYMEGRYGAVPLVGELKM